MLVLALDTTSRPGSLALARDGELLGCDIGPRDRTHAERLPAGLVALLARHHSTLADVDLFGVAAGPGSFTGLRIGIATIQGLAFACRRPIVAVSALDALAVLGSGPGDDALVGAWIDARRGEVFSALYAASRRLTDSAAVTPRVIDAAAVDRPGRTLERWTSLIAGRPVRFTGDGAVAYRDLLEANAHPGVEIVGEPPALAPAIASIARAIAEAGGAVPPHAVKPLYVRRPDAELARDRRSSER